MIDDQLGADTLGLMIHLDSTNKPLPGNPSRQRAYMYGTAVSVGAVLHLLDGGDVAGAREQLLTLAEVQLEWVREDFKASYPLHSFMNPVEHVDTIRSFFTARCGYYVDEETGVITFEGQAEPSVSKPGDDGLAGVGAATS